MTEHCVFSHFRASPFIRRGKEAGAFVRKCSYIVMLCVQQTVLKIRFKKGGFLISFLNEKHCQAKIMFQHELPISEGQYPKPLTFFIQWDLDTFSAARHASCSGPSF